MTISPTLRPTRYPELSYMQQDRNLWRFVFTGDGAEATVGPQYRTKAELLADLERYAREWGF